MRTFETRRSTIPWVGDEVVFAEPFKDIRERARGYILNINDRVLSVEVMRNPGVDNFKPCIVRISLEDLTKIRILIPARIDDDYIQMAIKEHDYDICCVCGEPLEGGPEMYCVNSDCSEGRRNIKKL